MAPTDVSSADVRCPGSAWFAGRDADRAVVWLRGEHDLSTVAALSETLARAIALDTAGLVVDLSDVLFMDASTVGVIVRTREFLRQRSRSLALRSPSTSARRILDLCGLAELLDPASVPVTRMAGTAGALGTWVAVPATDRLDRPVEASAPKHEPADARTAHLAGRGGP